MDLAFYLHSIIFCTSQQTENTPPVCLKVISRSTALVKSALVKPVSLSRKELRKWFTTFPLDVTLCMCVSVFSLRRLCCFFEPWSQRNNEYKDVLQFEEFWVAFNIAVWCVTHQSCFSYYRHRKRHSGHLQKVNFCCWYKWISLASTELKVIFYFQ